MADAIVKLVLLVLLLAWSGYFVCRLATGILDAWKAGRLGQYENQTPKVRVVRCWVRPFEFWFAMAFWHLMIVVFVAVFVAGIYGMWRVIVPL